MIAYLWLTDYFGKSQWKIALWECCPIAQCFSAWQINLTIHLIKTENLTYRQAVRIKWWVMPLDGALCACRVDVSYSSSVMSLTRHCWYSTLMTISNISYPTLYMSYTENCKQSCSSWKLVTFHALNFLSETTWLGFIKWFQSAMFTMWWEPTTGIPHHNATQ